MPVRDVQPVKQTVFGRLSELLAPKSGGRSSAAVPLMTGAILLLALAIPWVISGALSGGRPAASAMPASLQASLTTTAAPTRRAGTATAAQPPAAASTSAVLVRASLTSSPVTATVRPVGRTSQPAAASPASQVVTPQVSALTPAPATATQTRVAVVLRLAATATGAVEPTVEPTAEPSGAPTASPSGAPAAPTVPPATAVPAPTPAVVSPQPPALVAPAQDQTVSGLVTFRWRPAGPLPPGAAYEVVVWNEDEPPDAARGVAAPTRDESLAADLDAPAISSNFHGSALFWTVLVVRTDPYVRLTTPGASQSGKMYYGR